MNMPTFADIPRELVLDSILPILSNRDILAIGATNHALLDLTSDSLLWEKRCGEDFNFAKSRLPEGYAFTWKTLYKKLANPIMYGWGLVLSIVLNFQLVELTETCLS